MTEDRDLNDMHTENVFRNKRQGRWATLHAEVGQRTVGQANLCHANSCWIPLHATEGLKSNIVAGDYLLTINRILILHPWTLDSAAV